MKKIGTEEQRQKIKSLIEEADRKGFKKGTFYTRSIILDDGSTVTHEEIADHRAELFHVYDDDRGLSLFCGPSQGVIYIRGNWTVKIDKKRSVEYW